MINLWIWLPAVLGLVMSIKEWAAVGAVKIDGHPDLLAKQDSKAAQSAKEIVIEMEKTVPATIPSSCFLCCATPEIDEEDFILNFHFSAWWDISEAS